MQRKVPQNSTQSRTQQAAAAAAVKAEPERHAAPTNLSEVQAQAHAAIKEKPHTVAAKEEEKKKAEHRQQKARLMEQLGKKFQEIDGCLQRILDVFLEVDQQGISNSNSASLGANTIVEEVEVEVESNGATATATATATPEAGNLRRSARHTLQPTGLTADNEQQDQGRRQGRRQPEQWDLPYRPRV
ncbi:hypothetical protein BJX70DRAFT_367455 [Aspergillus crustosus]